MRAALLPWIMMAGVACHGGANPNEAVDPKEAPLKIDSLNGRVSFDGQAIDAREQTFYGGTVTAEGPDSYVVILFDDQDRMRLTNGSASIAFGEADPLLSMVSDDSALGTDLNSRIVTLDTGDISFTLAPRDGLSKVRYQIIYRDREIDFKDADLTLNHDPGARLTVSRGSVSVTRQGDVSQEVRVVEAGESLDFESAEP